MDIVGGSSKFDVTIIPSVTGYHHIVPDEIIEPLVNALIPDLYLQNETVTTDRYYLGETITTGRNITNTIPVGDFIVQGTANVDMQGGEEVILKSGTHLKPDPGGSVHIFIQPFTFSCSSSCKMASGLDSGSTKTETIATDSARTLEYRDTTQADQTSSKRFYNYPNPFNDHTHISYSVDKEADILIELYNLRGQKISVIKDQRNHQKGEYVETFDTRKLIPGFYICTYSKNGIVTDHLKMNVVR